MYGSKGPDGTCLYSVGVARSAHILQPFKKLGNPILHTKGLPYSGENTAVTHDGFGSVGADYGKFTGPGHCSVITSLDGESQMVYHAWRVHEILGNYPRILLVDKVNWDEKTGWPSVYHGYPSDTPQPMP